MGVGLNREHSRNWRVTKFLNSHYVINYDLPAKSENYMHRLGRTGRGFNKGVAISFCSKEEKERLKEIRQFSYSYYELYVLCSEKLLP